MPQPASDNDDWTSYAKGSSSSPFYSPIIDAVPGSFTISDEFQERFPKLTELLSQSRLTVVTTKKGQRHLHTWAAPDGETFGWLCYPPETKSTDLPLHEDHRLMLTCFGGICDYWNAPDSLINNLNGVLGLADVELGFGEYGEELFREVTLGSGGGLQPKEHLVFSTEANGDFFVYHRETGKVLLIGFDTGRSDITHVKDYVDLVYTLDDAPDIRSWVELLAREYLGKVRSVTD